MGCILSNDGWSIDKNQQESIQWFTKASERHHVESINQLGLMMIEGKIIPKNTEEGMKMISKCAHQGLADSQFHLGYVLYNGCDSIKINWKESFEWIEKASQQGHEKALAFLVIMMKFSQGIEMDEETRIKQSHLLAKQVIPTVKQESQQGDSFFQNIHGLMLEHGIIVEQDYKQSIEWFLKAAQQGQIEACYNMNSVSESQKEELYKLMARNNLILERW